MGFIINVPQAEDDAYVINQKRIVAIGDSVTYGYPFGKGYSWLNFVEKREGREFINQGVCGDTTGKMRQRFEVMLSRYRPEYVLLLGGTNDACMNVTADAVADNIMTMINKSLLDGITPVLGIPVPCRSPNEEKILQVYRSWMRGYAQIREIVVIDFYQAFQQQADNLECLYIDELHPGLEGYRLMGKAANAVLGKQVFG